MANHGNYNLFMLVVFLLLIVLLPQSEPKLMPQQLISGSSVGASGLRHTDYESAIQDMRSKSYHGFAIFLHMLNGTTSQLLNGTGITFFMPCDSDLSGFHITPDQLKTFLMNHAMPTPLVFNDLIHFPNGTLIPSAFPDRMITIRNNGRSGFFVNNAQIVAPNICVNSLIKCHGIDTIIDYA